MALPTSGMISLNDIHVEAGGSSGTACTINDSDIRGLINKSSGAAMDFADWYGASAALDTQTVTVGYYTVTFYGSTTYMYGDTPSVSHGSISDGTANWAGGKTYKQLYYSFNNFNTTKGVSMALIGNQANSGFTTMTINGVNFARSSATYSYISSSNQSNWFWQYSTNVFGTTVGATKTVTFT
ncbi:hypothetical protein [Neptunomonas phycophila]|uniref:hypothetical protein n=1 Tax=Neptunomonas phycophila TaxID=1572645 RepID=UPI003510E328